MLETLKSIAFVLTAVMIALVLQAQAASLSPSEDSHDFYLPDSSSAPTFHDFE
jgi:hypothetical protein